MENKSWACPYCSKIQIITSSKFERDYAVINVGSKKYPELALKSWAIGCANPDCDEVEVKAVLCSAANNYKIGQKHVAHFNSFDQFATYGEFSLHPASGAKPQPSFIPSVIRQDYEEACKIVHLSPKASATLSRRCLQGMIRDFCKIKAKTLYAEIEKLHELEKSDKLPKGVTPESVEAAHAIRKIGNIGAHMEKDINIIIDVKQDEAKVLIELIETLFEDWYVARENRKQRFAKINEIAEQKSEAKKLPASNVASEKPN